MTTILIQTVGYFFILLEIIVFAHVILSWLTLLNINVKIQFLEDVIQPLYAGVKKVIPTQIGPIDFAPIIIIFGIGIVRNIVVTILAVILGVIPL